MLLTMASSSSTSLFSTFLNLSPQKTTDFICRKSVKIPSITKKTSLNLSSSHNISTFGPIIFNNISFSATPTSGNPLPLTVVCAKGYKMKTHKASAKRFKVSGTGKILRRRAGKQHLLRKKNAKRRNRLSKTVPVMQLPFFCMPSCSIILAMRMNDGTVEDTLVANSYLSKLQEPLFDVEEIDYMQFAKSLVQVDRSDYNNVIGALPYLKVNRAN